jgi:uncharacterized protein YndB with AHSA1/START domain
MSRTIAIAPVKKSIVVKSSQARAFEVFTAGIDRWWPKSHHIGAAPLIATCIEPFQGGRWYTKHEDGSEAVVGRMLSWEPPNRLVFTWEINAAWKSDPAVASEVEVNFFAEAPNVTRVELEHRNFEPLGEEGGRKLRADVDGGWSGILELFAKAAVAA